MRASCMMVTASATAARKSAIWNEADREQNECRKSSEQMTKHGFSSID